MNPHSLPAVGTAYTLGNHIEFLHDGEAIYDAMVSAIDGADECVDLESYAWWQGETTERFVDAMRRAAKRGVAVRLLIDLVGARLATDTQLYDLADNGVDVATFRRPSLRRPTTLTHRSHRRIMVVDHEIGFTGGAGIGDEWLSGGDDYPRQWRDLHARLRGPLVAMLESEFTQDFAIAKADPGIARAALLEPVDGGMPAALVRSVPQPDRTAVAIAFEAIMNHAKKSADLYSAFLAPHADVLEPLVAAASRGVRIRLLVPGREHVDKPISARTAESAFPALLEAGVEIYRYRPTMLHAKATVIDDHLVAFGTPNLNGRSFQRDRELMIVAEDEDLAEGLTARFEQDLEESDEAVSPKPSSLPGKLGRYAFDRLTHLLSGHV